MLRDKIINNTPWDKDQFPYYLKGRNFRGTSFHDIGHKSRKYVQRNLQNIEQPRRFAPQNLMIFSIKKK